MSFGGQAMSETMFRERRQEAKAAFERELGRRMTSPKAPFKLSRGIRPDERFKTMAELAARIHQVRRGAPIQCVKGFNPRVCEPNGPCVAIRYPETGELLGYAFLEETSAQDVARLQAAIRAAEPKPDFYAVLGDDAELRA